MLGGCSNAEKPGPDMEVEAQAEAQHTQPEIETKVFSEPIKATVTWPKELTPGQNVEIRGKGFGERIGKVLVEGHPAEILDWVDLHIRIVAPKDLAVAICKVEVQFADGKTVLKGKVPVAAPKVSGPMPPTYAMLLSFEKDGYE